MSTIPLIATQAYPYGGRSLKTGDRFDASAKDAALLKLIGRATDAPVVGPVRTLLTRALEPERDIAEPNDEEQLETRPKRRYRRRDLVPEP